jgi:hypothetical protein
MHPKRAVSDCLQKTIIFGETKRQAAGAASGNIFNEGVVG